MTDILVTASAPDRATALGVMAALGIADISTGEPVSLVEVHIAEVPSTEGATRSLWNFLYYGASASALMKPEPEGGWPPEADMFERTNLLDMVDARTGLTMEWAAFLGPDGEPPGYELPNGVRLYDPSYISSASLAKQ